MDRSGPIIKNSLEEPDLMWKHVNIRFQCSLQIQWYHEEHSIIYKHFINIYEGEGSDVQFLQWGTPALERPDLQGPVRNKAASEAGNHKSQTWRIQTWKNKI